MSDARAAIFGQLRAGLGKGDATARRAALEAALVQPPRGPQPQRPADLAARFRGRAEALASTVDTVAARADVPAAVLRYLGARGLPPQAVATPELAGADWGALSLRFAAAVDADSVGISGCFCAIAETGTLMLLSAPETPATVSLLPETHIALVDVLRIVPTMEDAFALLRTERGRLPRAVNFVSGPSRTGDIEQTIVLGAHGPRHVHLILIGS